MNIVKLKDIKNSTFNDIAKYQRGEKVIIKTGRDLIDDWGLTPASLISIGGASFTGKTMELEELKANIMSVNYNPKANNYVWLSNSLEMTDLSTTLRQLSVELGLSKKEILNTTFDDAQKEKIRAYRDRVADDRFFYNSEQPTPEEFLLAADKFLADNIDKDLAVIDFDHSALVKNDGNAKKSMDALYNKVLELKQKYINSLFIFISQFNRESLGRIEERSNLMVPGRGDFYQSDSLFHVSDIVYALIAPYQLGVEEYRLVNPKFFDHLTEHMTPLDKKKNKISFYTYGRIFHEVLKNRFADGFAFKRTFIKVIEDDTEYMLDKLKNVPEHKTINFT